MSGLSSILIIRLSSLGDVLMTIPAVKGIRNKFPGAHISWLAEGPVSEFLACQDFIDEVIIFPRSNAVKALKTGNVSRAGKALAPFLQNIRKRKYDLVVDFHGIAKSALFAMVARGTKKIGFGDMFAKEKSHFFYHDKINGSDKRMHKVERNMLLASHLGYAGPVPRTVLKTSDDATAYINNFLRETGNAPPAFAVNPFSSKGTDFKRWPMERYAELIARIYHELHKQTVILWGPGEEEAARQLKEMSGDGAYLACPTNIPQLFALLGKVRTYIGGDTGVMHLAAAAGTQVIAIFGPTDFKINGPYGKEHAILREDVPCSPCKKRDCSDRRCLAPVTVERVFETVNDVLKRSETN
jgi:lipopolysaccharide heptosyltransferase I